MKTTPSEEQRSEEPQIENRQPLEGLLFETNFENDTGYEVSNLGLWNGGAPERNGIPTARGV